MPKCFNIDEKRFIFNSSDEWVQWRKDNSGSLIAFYATQRNLKWTGSFETVSNENNFNKKNLFSVTPRQAADAKATIKASIATQYIGFGEGINDSSTELYRQQVNKQYDEAVKEGNARPNTTNIPQNLQSGVEQYGTLQYANDKAQNLLGKNVSSIEMIETGFKTRTTRTDSELKKYNIKVGSYIKMFGTDQFGNVKNVIVKITKITKGYDDITWYKEGWTEEGLAKLKAHTNSANAVEFEVIRPANSGNYSNNDVIFVSVGGKRGTELQQKEQQDRTIKEALKAIEAGATLITDNKSYVDNNSYNTGEKRLAQNLEAKGYNYSETTIDGQLLGVWNKKTQNKNINDLNNSNQAITNNVENTTDNENIILDKFIFQYDGKTIDTEIRLSENQSKGLKFLIDAVSNKAEAVTLEGPAGTGKTTIISYLEKYYDKNYEFKYLAPTHAATAVLASSIVKNGVSELPSTIASATTVSKKTNKRVLSSKLKFSRPRNNVLVVDETSMTSNVDINNLIEAAKDAGAIVIFLGDKKQISAVVKQDNKNDVSYKTVSKAFSDYPAFSLTDVFRQKSEEFINLLNNIRNSTTFQPFVIENNNEVKFQSKEDFENDMKQAMLSDPENTLHITYTNDDVKAANELLRKTLGREGNVVPNDIIRGYAGYNSKQILNGNIANSISYTVTSVEPQGQFVIITGTSNVLTDLSSKGVKNIPAKSSTRYLMLSPNDSITHSAITDELMEANNQFVANQFRMVQVAIDNYKKNPRAYAELLDVKNQVSNFFKDYDLGDKYVYDSSINRMILYNANKHYKIDASLVIDRGIDYGHASTVHKSQGSTIKNVFFSTKGLNPSYDVLILENDEQITTEHQSLYYVGMSRASDKLNVYLGGLQGVIVENLAVPEIVYNNDTLLKQNAIESDNVSPKTLAGKIRNYDATNNVQPLQKSIPADTKHGTLSNDELENKLADELIKFRQLKKDLKTKEESLPYVSVMAKDKSEFGKINNETFDNEYAIASSMPFKISATTPLDGGTTSWEIEVDGAIFDRLKSSGDIIDSDNALDSTKTFINPAYQMRKMAQGSIGKKGIGIFALNHTTIGILQNMGVNISINEETGEPIHKILTIKDHEGNIVSNADTSLSKQYDLVSEAKLKALHDDVGFRPGVIFYDANTGKYIHQEFNTNTEKAVKTINDTLKALKSFTSSNVRAVKAHELAEITGNDGSQAFYESNSSVNPVIYINAEQLAKKKSKTTLVQSMMDNLYEIASNKPKHAVVLDQRDVAAAKEFAASLNLENISIEDIVKSLNKANTAKLVSIVQNYIKTNTELSFIYNRKLSASELESYIALEAMSNNIELQYSKDDVVDNYIDSSVKTPGIKSLLTINNQAEFVEKYNSEVIASLYPNAVLPALKSKTFHNIINESLTVDAANNIEKLEKSGITEWNINIPAAMTHFGYSKMHDSILLNNPALVEFQQMLSAESSPLNGYENPILRENRILKELTDAFDYSLSPEEEHLRYTFPSEDFVIDYELLYPANITAENKKQVQLHRLQAVYKTLEFKNAYSDFVPMFNLFNIDAGKKGSSMINTYELVNTVDKLLSNRSFGTLAYKSGDETVVVPKYNLDKLLTTAPIGTSLSNLSKGFRLFNKPELALTGRVDGMFNSLYDTYKTDFDINPDTTTGQKKLRNFSEAVVSFIKTMSYSRVPENDNIEIIKYNMLKSNASLYDRISQIKRIAKDPANVNSIQYKIYNDGFLNKVSTKIDKGVKYVIYQPSRVTDKQNIVNKFKNYYNHPEYLLDGYTTKDYVMDLANYVMAISDVNEKHTWSDLLPEALRKIIYQNTLSGNGGFVYNDSQKEQILETIYLNNPDILPLKKLSTPYGAGEKYMNSIFTKPYVVDDRGSIWKYVEFENPKLVRSKKETGGYVLMPKIADKTFLKQYTYYNELTKASTFYNVLDPIRPSLASLTRPSKSADDVENTTDLEHSIATSNSNMIDLITKSSDPTSTAISQVYDNISKYLSPIDASRITDMISSALQYTAPGSKPLSIVIVDSIDNNISVLGNYNRVYNQITVSREALLAPNAKYKIEGIILHELMHNISSNTIDIYQRIKSGDIPASALPKDVIDSLDFLESVRSEYKYIYGSNLAGSNLHEFVSEFIRSNKTRNEVGELANKNLVSRVWNSIVKFVTRMISGDSRVDPEMLKAQVWDAISNIANTKVEHYNGGDVMYQYTIDASTNQVVSGQVMTLVNAKDPSKANTWDALLNPQASYNEVIQLGLDPISINNISILQKLPVSFNMEIADASSLYAELIEKRLNNITKDGYTHHDLILVLNKTFDRLLGKLKDQKVIKEKSLDYNEKMIATLAISRIEEELFGVAKMLKNSIEFTDFNSKLSGIQDIINEVRTLISRKDLDIGEINRLDSIMDSLFKHFNVQEPYNILYTEHDLSEINASDEDIRVMYAKQQGEVSVLTQQLRDKLKAKNTEINIEKFGAKYDPSLETLNTDINSVAAHAMAIDRTGDQYLDVHSVQTQEAKRKIEKETREELLTFFDLAKKALSKIKTYYDRDAKLMAKYEKFGDWGIFINDNGSFVQRFNKDFYDIDSKYKKRINKLSDPLLKQVAQSEYSKWRYENTYTKSSDIDPSKATTPELRRHLQEVKNIFDAENNKKQQHYLIAKQIQEQLGKDQELDIKSQIAALDLTNTDDLLTKIELEKELSSISFKLSDWTSKYNPKMDEMDVSGRVPVYHNGKKTKYTVYPSYEYRYFTPKENYLNDLEFLNDPDIAEFYNAYVNIIRKIMSVVPEHYEDRMSISQLLFMDKDIQLEIFKGLSSKDNLDNLIASFKNKVHNNLTSREVDSANDMDETDVYASFSKIDAYNKHNVVRDKLIAKSKAAGFEIIDALGNVNPDAANKNSLEEYTPKYQKFRDGIVQEVEAELNELRSFDLVKIATTYLMAAIQYKVKSETIDEVNATEKLAYDNFDRTGAKNKKELLKANSKSYRGGSAREPFLPVKFAGGKRYTPVESSRKKTLEDSIVSLIAERNSIIDKLLADPNIDKDTKNILTELRAYNNTATVSKKINTNKQVYDSLTENFEITTHPFKIILDNIESLLDDKVNEADKLGGYIYAGNVWRLILKIQNSLTFTFSILSFMPNMLQGTFSNDIQASDGRIFSEGEYKKHFKDVYLKSDSMAMITGTAVGTAAMIAAGPLLGLVGIPAYYLAKKFTRPSSETNKSNAVFNRYDVFQNIQEEIYNIRKMSIKYNSAGNIVDRVTGEILDKKYIFTNESEKPHQLTVLASIFGSTKLSRNGDPNSATTMFEYMNEDGTVKNPNEILTIHAEDGTVVKTINAEKLMDELVSLTINTIAITHGDYRPNRTQLGKYKDWIVGLFMYRTWYAEGLARRIEDGKGSLTIDQSLTATKYKTAENMNEKYETKGMYRSLMENSGSHTALAAAAFPGLRSSVFANTVSAFTGSPLSLLIPISHMALYGGMAMYMNKKNTHEDIKPEVTKKFLQGILIKALRVPFTNKYLFQSESKMDEIEKYFGEVMSPADAANYRALIKSQVLSIWLNMLYIVALMAKAGDDDDDQNKNLNYALNLSGRMLLDLDSYTSPSDMISKVKDLESIFPGLKLVHNVHKLMWTSLDQYKTNADGHEKGDLKFQTNLNRLLPIVNKISSFNYNVDGEIQLFKTD